MKYYIGSIQCDPNYLEHYGKKGMHWGERRYQNPDGSLTPEGREHYGVGERQETRGRDIYEKQQIRRMNRAYNKVSRLDRRIVGDGTARQNRKLEKARQRYAEAQGNLDRYHNSTAEEQKKARNKVRLKRAAIASAVLASAAAVGVAAISATKYAKLGKSFEWDKMLETEKLQKESDKLFNERSRQAVADSSLMSPNKPGGLRYNGQAGTRYYGPDTQTTDWEGYARRMEKYGYKRSGQTGRTLGWGDKNYIDMEMPKVTSAPEATRKYTEGVRNLTRRAGIGLGAAGAVGAGSAYVASRARDKKKKRTR